MMDQISNEKVGQFIACLRREQQLTQRQLAERLYVSDKAVSKWERGESLPSVALLMPLARCLGVSVNELLNGSREPAQQLSGTMRMMTQRQRSRWRISFWITLGLSLSLWIACLCAGAPVRQLGEPAMAGLVMLGCAAWLVFFARELLPSYYDEHRISFVTQGILRIHLGNTALNNANWLLVCAVLKGSMMALAIAEPAALLISLLLGAEGAWLALHRHVLTAAMLVMLAAVWITARKYA